MTSGDLPLEHLEATVIDAQAQIIGSIERQIDSLRPQVLTPSASAPAIRFYESVIAARSAGRHLTDVAQGAVPGSPRSWDLGGFAESETKLRALVVQPHADPEVLRLYEELIAALAAGRAFNAAMSELMTAGVEAGRRPIDDGELGG